jgi:hypothetical protein
MWAVHLPQLRHCLRGRSIKFLGKGLDMKHGMKKMEAGGSTDKDYTADDMTISPTARKAMEEQEAQSKLDAEQERRQKGMEEESKGKFRELRKMLGVKPPVKKAKGGSVKSSASKRGDGIAQRGKTKGRMV